MTKPYQIKKLMRLLFLHISLKRSDTILNPVSNTLNARFSNSRLKSALCLPAD